MPEPLSIVFFGAPGYAVPALNAMASDPQFDVRLVVTQPDRPAGRGHRLSSPPVKQEAERLGLSIYQPESLRSAEARAPLMEAAADLFVVAAYGLIFGEKTLAIPGLACLNLHASLLPAYRGASPVSAAILNGDRETGVTLMVMERGLDTGLMIAKDSVAIGQDETTESLTARLSAIGAELALNAIPRFAAGDLQPNPQPGEGASLVRPLVKADGRLDWSKPAIELERHVRAMWPWPRAWFSAGNVPVQVHAATVDPHLSAQPGTVALGGDGVVVACAQGGLRLDRIQLPGGNPSPGRQMISTARLISGQVLPFGGGSAELAQMIRPID